MKLKGIPELKNRTCPGCGNDGSKGVIFAVLNGRSGALWKASCQCSVCFQPWDEYFDEKSGIVTNILTEDEPEWLQKERQLRR